MSAASRPDLSGFMAFLGFNQAPRNCLEGVYLVVRSRDGRSFDTAIGREIVSRLCSGLVPVWTTDGTTKTLVHPRGEIAGFVISGAAPPARLREEVAAWRSRYAMFR